MQGYRVQKYHGTGIHGYRDTELYHGTGIRGYRDTEKLLNRNGGIQGYRNTMGQLYKVITLNQNPLINKLLKIM